MRRYAFYSKCPFNTVYSNIHTRIGEIGMQRAIGMSAASLYKTFLWEGAYYGIFASAIGAVLGYVCCIFVGATQTDTLQMVAVPLQPFWRLPPSRWPRASQPQPSRCAPFPE